MRSKTFLALAGLTILAHAGFASGQTYHVKEARIIAAGEGTHPFNGRGNLIAGNDGVWILGYTTTDKHGVGSARGTVHFRFSDDEGRSWTAEDVYLDGSPVVTPGQAPTSDRKVYSVFLLKTPEGELLCSVYQRDRDESWQMRSTDNGRSWHIEKRTDIWKPWGHFNKDGQMVVSHVGQFTEGYNFCQVRRSSDGGRNWQFLSTAGAENTSAEGSVMWVDETRWLMIQRGWPHGKDQTLCWRYFSDDAGRTWHSKMNIHDQLMGIGEPRLYKFPEQTGDRIFLCARQMPDLEEDWKHKLVLAWTDDGGETWDHLQVNDGFDETGRASLLPRENGELYFVGYVGRPAERHAVETDIWAYVIGQK